MKKDLRPLMRLIALQEKFQARLAVIEQRLAALQAHTLLLPVSRHDYRGVVQRAKQLVAARFNITVQDIDGRLRTDAIVLPRYIVIHLIKRFTPLCLNEIGRLMNRHNANIHHALNQLPCWIVTRPGLATQIAEIEQQFSSLLV